MIRDREVLILGAGQGVAQHRDALDAYVRGARPLVIALNTQGDLSDQLIDLRVACHPVRLMADCELHLSLPQPLITPASMLAEDLRALLKDKEILDFGIDLVEDCFEFNDNYCVVPSLLVLAYALSVAITGKANRILLAGFDGYAPGDRRSLEVENILGLLAEMPDIPEIFSITPTRYKRLKQLSVYGM